MELDFVFDKDLYAFDIVKGNKSFFILAYFKIEKVFHPSKILQLLCKKDRSNISEFKYSFNVLK